MRCSTALGEQLEATHLARLRAQAAHDIIEQYIAFSKNDTSKLDDMRKDSGKEGRQKVAVLLRRLKIVAAETDIAGADTVRDPVLSRWLPLNVPAQTREYIDKYCETFEQDILKLFDKSYRKGDPKMMHVRSPNAIS